ncbi:MAG: hypothetical protein IJB33_02600 [Akkermansia sp.]|nr:hypothetical protein [Akkermansia sp.]
MIAAVEITDTLPAGADAVKKQPARKPRKSMSRSQMKEYLAKKLHALEMAQAAIAIEDSVLTLFQCEYERLQDYFIAIADRRLFEVLSEYGAYPPTKLATLRQHAQEIANVCLPYGLKWDWKLHLRLMVEDKALPPCYSDFYKLDEPDMLTR